jgi:hypothetical protein
MVTQPTVTQPLTATGKSCARFTRVCVLRFCIRSAEKQTAACAVIHYGISGLVYVAGPSCATECASCGFGFGGFACGGRSVWPPAAPWDSPLPQATRSCEHGATQFLGSASRCLTQAALGLIVLLRRLLRRRQHGGSTLSSSSPASLFSFVSLLSAMTNCVCCQRLLQFRRTLRLKLQSPCCAWRCSLGKGTAHCPLPQTSGHLGWTDGPRAARCWLQCNSRRRKDAGRVNRGACAHLPAARCYHTCRSCSRPVVACLVLREDAFLSRAWRRKLIVATHLRASIVVLRKG